MSPLHAILFKPTHYFVPPPVVERPADVRYRIRQNPRGVIIGAIKENGGKATALQIYDLTDGDISVSLAMHHLQAMKDEGLLDCRPGKGDKNVKGGRRATVWLLK